MAKWWPAFALWLCVASAVFASPLDDFKAAGQLYDAEKFPDAVAAYEKIEPKTANLYFNIGNTYFRSDQLGKAVLNYERARRLAPRDPDILANLKFAQERLGVDEINNPPKAVAKFFHSAVLSRTVNEWAAYELVGLWLTALGVGVCVWRARGRTLLISFSVAAFIWFAATLSCLAYRFATHRNAPTAVVVANRADARFAPLADATVHFKLTEGTKVAIKEDRGQWLFIERADGQQGWITKDAVERVGLH